MGGFPDWQRITEWIGAPLVTQTGFAIGAGSHTDGPFPVGSWSSVVLAMKPTGGAITATVRQLVAGGPASLILDTVLAASAGQVLIESVPLLAGDVELILQGAAGGETVDYALSPANTTTHTVAVGGGGVVGGLVSAAGAKVAGSGFSVARTANGVYTVTFDTAFAAAPIVLATVDLLAVTTNQWWPVNVCNITVNGFTAIVSGGASGAAPIVQDGPFSFMAQAIA